MSDHFSSADAAVFRFGEFTFDCGSRLLLRNGVERHLSPKAQQLLRLLLLARPRALSREELYDEIWPSTFVCETNMAGIVSEVRRALGDGARESQYIRTVHGFGYAFSGDVASASAIGAMLLCEGGRHPLYQGANSVGRARDCGVVLTDNTVSRRHAVITIVDGMVWIEDLDSKNGTFVDGEIIRRSMLTERSRIELGAVRASIAPQKVSTTKGLQLDMPELKRQVEERMADASLMGATSSRNQQLTTE